MKKYTMPIRDVDRDIFDMIKSGEKQVETRAAGPRYEHIKEGDTLIFTCGDEKFERTIVKRTKFESVKDMLKKYKLSDIHPRVQTADELIALYRSFPEYEERLRKYGILAFELS